MKLLFTFDYDRILFKRRKKNGFLKIKDETFSTLWP